MADQDPRPRGDEPPDLDADDLADLDAVWDEIAEGEADESEDEGEADE